MSVVGIGVADVVRQLHVPRQRIDLRLVQVRDRLHVRAAVAVLHEEALIVFESIRRADHRVVQAVGMEVLDRLADALLVVRRRDDLQILAYPEAFLLDFAAGRLHDELEVVDLPFECRR